MLGVLGQEGMPGRQADGLMTQKWRAIIYLYTNRNRGSIFGGVKSFMHASV